MIRVALAQLRTSWRRLLPAGLAVALGTGFVTVTLLAGSVLTRATYDQVTARYGSADLVVDTGSAPFTAADLARVRTLPGVQAADVQDQIVVRYRSDRAQTSGLVSATPSDPRLSALVVRAGRTPTGDGEIALDSSLAGVLGVSVGGEITVVRSAVTADGTAADVATTVRVVGTLDDPAHAWASYGGLSTVSPATAQAWSPDGSGPVLVVSDDVSATERALATALPGARVQTRDQAAAVEVSGLTSGSNQLVGVVLGFAALALLIAALVIVNTFSVLVAQRTRTLALLRCVGARRRQVRAAMLVEGGALGLIASATGLVVGLAVGQGALWGLRGVDVGLPIPTAAPVAPTTLLVPLLVGTLVTTAASMVPARAAGRVAPVAALRPADGPGAGTRVGGGSDGRGRLVASVALTVLGAVVLVGAVVRALTSSVFVNGTAILGVGVLGGAASFVGVAVGAVFWTPVLVRAAGALLRRLGPAARLAAANTGRNPRRTAVTALALTIGVALVVTVSTGAATARRSLDEVLDLRYPVDVVVETESSQLGQAPVAAGYDQGTAVTSSALTDATVAAVAAAPGVASATGVQVAQVTTAGGQPVLAMGVDPVAAGAVLHDRAVAAALAAGQVVLSDGLAGEVSAGRTHLVGAHGPVELSAVTGWRAPDVVVMPSATLAALAPTTALGTVWVAEQPGASASGTLDAVRQAVAGTSAQVVSATVARERNERLIDVMLAVVVGLLAVAVVIAVIGVANTLALSVVERRRESATLRAVGLTRGQLRRSLATEGVLVAVIGLAAGTVLGVGYGWAGSALVFGPVVPTRPTVAWSDLAGVLLVGTASGLLASVLPARAAARTPPVAALAQE